MSSERDPLQPFGSAPPPSVSVEEFKPTETRRNWFWAALAVVLVAVAAFAIPPLFSPGTDELTAPTATPSSTPSYTPLVGDDSKIPFEYGSATGVFEILDSSWSDGKLVVNVRLSLQSGTMSYSFFSFEHGTGTVVDPSYGLWADELPAGTLNSGETVTGRVTFEVPKGKTTIVLAGGNRQTQVTALLVNP